VHVLNVAALVILLVIAGVAGLQEDEEVMVVVGGAEADQAHIVEATADHAQEAHVPDHVPAHHHNHDQQDRSPGQGQGQKVPTLVLGLLLVLTQNHQREKIEQTGNLLEDGVEVGAKANHHLRGVVTHEVQLMLENHLPLLVPITPPPPLNQL